MINQQIAQFTNSLQNIATEYSDPSVILQHIPVLKDYPMFQSNPEYIFYGFGGIVALLILKRILKKRAKSSVKDVALVMPQPYRASDEAPETAQDALDGSDLIDRQTLADMPEPTLDALPENSPRGLTQQLEDVNAISFSARPAMTPDEARMRVLVQAVLNDFGAGYMIMARTALGALIAPGSEAVGPERAHAIAAIADKYLDFAIFDRAGRCILALDVTNGEPAIGNKALERAVVHSALGQAGLPMANLRTSDTPADVRSKIAGYLKPIAQGQPPRRPSAVNPKSNKAPRPGRPTRPVRAAHAAAIAAE